jgi:hypothetical protein
MTYGVVRALQVIVNTEQPSSEKAVLTSVHKAIQKSDFRLPVISARL